MTKDLDKSTMDDYVEGFIRTATTQTQRAVVDKINDLTVRFEYWKKKHDTVVERNSVLESENQRLKHQLSKENQENKVCQDLSEIKQSINSMKTLVKRLKPQ